jgi:hypothetical protein
MIEMNHLNYHQLFLFVLFWFFCNTEYPTEEEQFEDAKNRIWQSTDKTPEEDLTKKRNRIGLYIYIYQYSLQKLYTDRGLMRASTSWGYLTSKQPHS